MSIVSFNRVSATLEMRVLVLDFERLVDAVMDCRSREGRITCQLRKEPAKHDECRVAHVR